MNFFNDKDLALRLNNNAVSSREKFLYFLFLNLMLLIIAAPTFVLLLYSNTQINIWIYIVDAVNVGA